MTAFALCNYCVLKEVQSNFSLLSCPTLLFATVERLLGFVSAETNDTTLHQVTFPPPGGKTDWRRRANTSRGSLASKTRLGISRPCVEQMDKTTLGGPAEMDD